MADLHGRRTRLQLLLLPDVFLRLEDAADADNLRPSKWVENLVISELEKLAKEKRVL